MNEGIFRKNGLDVDVCVSQGDVNDLKRIVGIEAPTAYRCKPNRRPAPIVISGGEGMPFVRRFEANSQPDGRDWVTLATFQNRTNYTLIARKDITQPEQLRGKRIAIKGQFNIMDFQALLFTNAMGWKVGQDVTLMISDEDLTLDGLRSGKFDAYICGEALPAWQAAQMDYKPLIDFKQWKIPMSSSGVNVDRAWLRDNREAARRFIKSVVEAIAIMKQDRRAAFRAMAKYYGITDPKMQEFLYSSWDFPAKPYPSVEGLRVAKALYAGHPGLRDEEFRNARVEDSIDDSFIRELDQSGYIDSLYKR
jgi:ABC-type nitrate/sulfonate/bicarbonate transport system substrate-binding protein